MHLEGKALIWFQDLVASGELVGWEKFAIDLQTRFNANVFMDPVGNLINLSQTTSVEEYKGQFKEHANRVRGLSESFKLSFFLNGLKEELKLTVKMMYPTSVSSAYALAKLQEENIQITKRALSKAFTQHPVKPRVTNWTPKPNPTPNLNVKRITQAEATERRQKGLCYHCDERWAKGHVCKSPKLFMIDQVFPRKDYEFHHEEREEVTEGHDVSGVMEEPDDPLITIQALTGGTSTSSLRLIGSLNGYKISLLVDTGSTHNFLDPSLSQKLKLSPEPQEPLMVRVANGEMITSEGKCSQVPIKLQGHVFPVDFLLLPLVGCDAVLGVQWLKNIGPTIFDFQKLILVVKWHGK